MAYSLQPLWSSACAALCVVLCAVCHAVPCRAVPCCAVLRCAVCGHCAGSVEACVAKAMRLKAGVEMALKSGGGKQPRAYTSRSYDDMSVEAAGGNGDGGGGASGDKEGKKTIEIDKDEL
jgi:uncharacterized membrane protein YgcG